MFFWKLSIVLLLYLYLLVIYFDTVSNCICGSFSSKPQINIHNRDKGSGGVLQVADEPSPEAISRAPKSLGNILVLSLQFV